MKRLTIITLLLTAFFLAACGSDSTTPAPIPTPIINMPAPDPEPAPEPPPPAPVINTPDPEPAPPIFSLMVYDAAGAGFSNGTIYQDWRIGKVTPAGPGLVAVDDILYTVDAQGNEVSAVQLPAIPSVVALSGTDIWTFETIPVDYAAANGGMFKEYTRLWLNYAESGTWLDRQYVVMRAVTTLSGDVVAYDTLIRPYTVTGPEAPHYASEGGIFVHSVDAVARTGRIMTDTGNFNISWATNFFNSANQWLEINGAWYSWNGYIWNATDGLAESATAMTDFLISPVPYVIEVGTRVEASLERGYWIEANTGWLWRYTPETDTLEQATRLYVMAGTRADGALIGKAMEPQIIDMAGNDSLYYVYDGYVWRYDFVSGINGPFMADKKVRGL